jgi:hypothetical protein
MDSSAPAGWCAFSYGSSYSGQNRPLLRDSSRYFRLQADVPLRMMYIKEEFCLFFREVESRLKVLSRIRGVDMRVPKVI